MVSGIDRLILSRKGSSDVSGRFDLDFLPVVDYLRSNVVSVVNLVSFNVDSSGHFSVFLLGRLSNWVSLNESVLLFDENRVKGLGDGVHVRLDDDLLSCWLNESINDMSGWSEHSFSNYFWFFHNSVDYDLRLGA